MLKEQEERMASGKLARYRFYLRKRPVMLAVLSALVVVFFLAVTGLSQAYHAQRESLGNRWFLRGVADLNAKQYAAAITEFRAALLYSRDNYSYQLNLAEALIGLQHTGEASAYLLNLWEREPENGVVNLELARIAAQQGKTNDAIRYYHDAVYAAWPPDQEGKRRDARVELIELLLRIRSVGDAQAELMALAANEKDEPEQQELIGDLFVQAGDYEHALAAYRIALRSDRHSARAMAGAGYAAFQLGQYPVAERYLQAAVVSNPDDTQSGKRLETTEMVLNMDPFQRQIPAAERDRLVVEAFTTAGQRLKTCAGLKDNDSTAANSAASLSYEWTAMNPRVNTVELRRDPDLVEKAMDLVFRIERQTSNVCGAPTGANLALLLISKLHEGS